MKSFRAPLRPLGLCIGIVITASIAWWVAGPEKRAQKPQEAVIKSQNAVKPAAALRLAEGKTEVPWEKWTGQPVVPVALSPYQQRLIGKATLLEQRQYDARGAEPAREVRLWRTAFKHPLVREEVWLLPDKQGQRQPVRREFSVADHAMVQFPAQTTHEQILAWVKRHGFQLRQSLKSAPVHLIAAENGSLNTADSIMSAFRQAFPQSEARQGTAERDFLVFPSLFPTDTSFPQLWGLHNTGQTGGTTDADIDAPAAWDITTGSRDVLVGVIDTGVDRDHPDLEANMWTNPHEIAGNSLDDDGNGYVDDVHGWDFFANDNDPMDEEGHGTHCSGTIGGVGNNLTGVTGVCWQVSIVGLRFLGPSGGSTSDAIEAVNYSRELGVDLTSNSWGGGGFSSLLQTAIANSGAADQLFIAAAGNDGLNTDITTNYPSGYAVDSIIAVASSTHTDARSSFSNYGATSVDLAAPGSTIYSTVPGASYATYSGTSMATPHVAGAVALLKSIAPGMTAGEIKSRLLSTVDPVSAFTSTTVSRGRMNVARLIEQSVGPRPVITVTIIEEESGNGDGINNPGETLALRFTVVNRGNQSAQNISATLSSLSASSNFTLTQSTVNLGTLTSGQSVISPTPFLVQAKTNVGTPAAEEFLITLSHGNPLQTSEHRVSLYLHTSSRIAGRVTDAADSSPLVGATVRITGTSSFTTQSDGSGAYAVTVPDGVYQVTASASGYVSSLPAQLSAPPGRSGLDFALGVPQLGLTPSSLAENVYSGRTLTRTVEMRNRGSAPLVWSLELVNGQLAGAAALPMISLPAAELPTHRESPDTGLSAGFKSQEKQLLPALNAPLGSLTGVQIGAVSTVWDRSVLISDLQARGAQVVTLTLPLTEAALADVEAVIIDDSLASLSLAEVTMLRDRIVAGAGLLCEADNSGSITRMNQLLAGTGMTAVYNGGFTDITFTDIRPHPMTAGVTSLREVAVGASATLSSPAQTLVGDPSGRAHAAVSSLGAGVVVFVGNELTDGGNFSTGDGRLFANQIIDGLVSRPAWLAVSSNSGMIPAGGVSTLTFTFSPGELTAGSYQATALLTTNIPDEPETRLPISMNLTDAPEISVTPAGISFGSVVEGVAAQRSASLRNIGRGPLQIRSIRLEGADAAHFSLPFTGTFSLPAGGTSELQVDLSTQAPVRALQASLVIESDDPLTPTLSLPISGARQLPPEAVSTTQNIRLTLKQGDPGSANVHLANEGTGPLAWQASLGFRPGQTGISPTWVRLPGVSGIYQPDATGQIRLNFDTGVLPPGVYSTTLFISSNDVDTPELSFPIQLTIIAAPRPVMTQSATFANTLLGTTRRLQVQVQNLGDAPFQISAATSLSTSFRSMSPLPFIVAGRSTRLLEIDFRATRVGTFTGSIVFTVNTAERYRYITFTGTCIRGGLLSSSPASLSLTTPPGPNSQRSFKLTNSGQLPVTWSASLEGGEGFTLGTPRSGTLMPAAFTTLNLSLLTSQRAAGTYRSKLVITSDTAKPRLEIPLTLTVTRAARLTLNPASLVVSGVWSGREQSASFLCVNEGNLPLSIVSISENSPRLSLGGGIALPYSLAPGASLPVTFKTQSSTAGTFQDSITVETTLAAQKKVTMNVETQVILPPAISVTPASLDETLQPGQKITRDLSITNTGGAPLSWSSSVRDLLGPAGTLTTVRSQFETSSGSVSALLNNSYALTEGISGSNIVDGGANMFDFGNAISTNLSPTALPYSDSSLSTHAGVGAGGSYFTRKKGPLWLCVADLEGASRFTISGGLGADGTGTATGGSVTRTVAGVTYRGFFKRVTGTANPSVNHLIILEDRPGLAHQFETNTDSDFHEVTGLSGSTRLYYLMFGLQNGAVYADNTFSLLMQSFLQSIVHPTALSWITPATSSGTTAAGASSPLGLLLDASQLPGGNYTATVRFLSDAQARPVLDVPTVIRVPSKAVLVTSPAALTFPDTLISSASSLSLTVSNPGNLPLNITALSLDSPVYSYSGVVFPLTLPPRQSSTFTIIFSPTTAQDHPASLTLHSNADGSPETRLNITGKGIRGPAIGITPGSLSVTVEPGTNSTHSLTLTNTGDAALQWTAIAAANLQPLTAISAPSGSVPAGETRPFNFQINASSTYAPGTYSGYIRFTSNDSVSRTLDVPVTITLLSRPRLSVVPGSVDFGQVFSGGSSTLSVQVRNTGNAPLTLTSITSNQAAFSSTTQPPPITLGVGGTLNYGVRFMPTDLITYTGQMRFTAPAATPQEVTLSLTGRGVEPPKIVVQPGQLRATLQKGHFSTQPLTLLNEGGSSLSWQTQVVNSSTPTGTLQDVLQRVNSSHAALTALIPNLYPFSEGSTGTSITDGGDDMYDGGNYLNTNLGASLSYSDNAVTSSTKLGTGGSYFTRKQTGLFVFVADMNNVSSFSISGNLGADGSGSVSGTTLTRSYGGRNYTGFLKCVSGTTDPSVNHLFIIETQPGVSQSYSPNTDNDDHTLSGMTGATRLYYLLFARSSGRLVNDALAGTIMDAFLQNIALPPGVPFITLSPAVGTTSAGGSSAVTAQFNTISLPIGTHTAAIRFTSNASINSTLDVPVTVEVTPAILSAEPASISTTLLTDGRGSTSSLALTALTGSSPAWTASSTVPWITLSKTSGTGSDSLTLTYSGSLNSGTHTGAVSIIYDGITFSVPVTATVRADSFDQLFTDYLQPDRMIGLITGTGSQTSLLVDLEADTLTARKILTLPAGTTDADIRSDGRFLYSLSHSSRTITEVNLSAFAISRTQSVPFSINLTASSKVEAGRAERIYYVDSATVPNLHVFDYDNAVNLSSHQLGSSIGTNDLCITPDGGTLYALSQPLAGGSTYLARLNSASDILSTLSVSATTLPQITTQSSPIFFSANRDAVFTKNANFSPQLTNSRTYPGQHIIAASAYGHALVSGASLLESAGGTSVHTLPVTTAVAAFTADQDALIYYNATSQQLVRLPLSGILSLPRAEITPLIADGSLQATAPSNLLWSGSPIAATYDVFLGSDAAAVAAATNLTGGIYRGNTTGTSYSIDSLMPGQTYYWRIDIRHQDGSTTAGPVWSFRLPAAAATPASVSASGASGGDASTAALSITTATSGTSWTLSESAPWLSLSQTSGTGSQSLTLTFTPGNLTAGTHSTQVTLTSGADSIQIPVSYRILGTLNIVKMVADPTLPRLYALHQDTLSTDGWLLWIDPATARIQHTLVLGSGVTDFTVHGADDRLYALSNNGTRVVSIDRQTTRQITGGFNLFTTTAAAIHNGPVGRVVLRSPANVLQMHHSVTGGAVGSAVSLPVNSVTRTPASGSFILAAVQQSSNVTGFARYTLGTSAINYSATQYWTGTYSSQLVLSGDGTRAFYNNRVYDTATLTDLFNLGAPIVASSWTGHIAWSSTRGYATASGTALTALPFTTSILAATADHAHLVLYHPTNRTLTRSDPGAITASAAQLGFSSAANTETLTLTNLGSQPVTIHASTDSAAFSVTAAPLILPAGSSQEVIVTRNDTSSTSATLHLTAEETGAELLIPLGGP